MAPLRKPRHSARVFLGWRRSRDVTHPAKGAQRNLPIKGVRKGLSEHLSGVGPTLSVLNFSLKFRNIHQGISYHQLRYWTPPCRNEGSPEGGSKGKLWLRTQGGVIRPNSTQLTAQLPGFSFKHYVILMEIPWRPWTVRERRASHPLARVQVVSRSRQAAPPTSCPHHGTACLRRRAGLGHGTASLPTCESTDSLWLPYSTLKKRKRSPRNGSEQPRISFHCHWQESRPTHGDPSAFLPMTLNHYASTMIPTARPVFWGAWQPSVRVRLRRCS